MIPDSVRSIVKALGQQEGVQGVSMQVGANVLYSSLPYPEPIAAQLAREIHLLMSGYSSAGRKVGKLFVSYGKLWLLLVNRGQSRVCVLTAPGCDLDSAVASAIQCLDAAPAETDGAVGEQRTVTTLRPGEVPTTEIKHQFLQSLNKVIGQAQAVRLIERELETLQLNGLSSLPFASAKALSLSLLERVPNRARRASIAFEFEAALQSIYPN